MVKWLKKRRKAIVAAIAAAPVISAIWATPGPLLVKIGATFTALAGVVGVERVRNPR